MEKLKEFIFENFQLIIIIGAILVSAIFNGLKAKRKAAAKQKQSGTFAPPPPAKTKEPSLEHKIRKFFDEIVEEKGPTKPKAQASIPSSEPLPSAPPPPKVEQSVPTMEPIPEPVEKRTRVHVKEQKNSIWAKEAAPAEKAPWEMPDGNMAYAIKQEPKKATTPTVSAGYETQHDRFDPTPGNKVVGDIVMKQLSKKDLRRAIVLKEILGKPVALKGEI